MSQTIEELIDAARHWRSIDPDPATRDRATKLIEAASQGDIDELRAAFGGPVGVGTAGFRAPMGPGPGWINRLSVRRIACAVAALMPPGAVVVGFDCRANSSEFARDAAATLLAAGREVLLIERPLPTPVLAHAVLARRCGAGLMITASHNPPGDNGVKVYGHDGLQLDPSLEDPLLAMVESIDPGEIEVSDAPVPKVADSVVAEYVEAIVGSVEPDGPRQVRAVYTALHGVGLEPLERAFERAGFGPPAVVGSQSRPDDRFPTTPRPNPEERGALDLAIELAADEGADVVLANDPDADRLGVAIPGPDAGGEWVVLTGDEIGALLAEHLLRSGTADDRLVATTVASSRLLAQIADHHRVAYAETATGFKWVMRAVEQRRDLQFVFAYEEALGFAVTDVVRDKDGLSAALVIAELVARRLENGETLWNDLARLGSRHGHHATRTVALELAPADRAAEASTWMDRLAGLAGGRIGGRAVHDLRPAAGDASTTIIELDGAARVVVRPSGTESKLKLYLEVVVEAGAADLESYRAARSASIDELDRLEKALRGWLGAT